MPVPSPQGDIQPDTGGTVQRVTIDIAQNICISVDPRKDTAKVPSPPLPPNAQPVVSPKMVGAEEYICNRDPEADEYYAMFFRACRKFRVEWAHASDKERAFIEEFVRVEFEKSMARKKGIPESSVRPFFG